MIAGQCPYWLALRSTPACQPPPLVRQGGPAFQRLSIHIESDPPTLDRPGNGPRCLTHPIQRPLLPGLSLCRLVELVYKVSGRNVDRVTSLASLGRARGLEMAFA